MHVDTFMNIDLMEILGFNPPPFNSFTNISTAHPYPKFQTDERWKCHLTI